MKIIVVVWNRVSKSKDNDGERIINSLERSLSRESDDYIKIDNNFTVTCSTKTVSRKKAIRPVPKTRSPMRMFEDFSFSH